MGWAKYNEDDLKITEGRLWFRRSLEKMSREESGNTLKNLKSIETRQGRNAAYAKGL